MNIPPGLASLVERESAHTWLKQIPVLLEELSDLWGLQLGDPFPDSTVSYTTSATQNNQAVVLKIQWPHSECLMEADALKVWRGAGAVRLLENDNERHALLLERCFPGTHLSGATDVDQIGVMVDLMPRLWCSTKISFRSLLDEATVWAQQMEAQWLAAGRPCEKQLIDRAIDYCQSLARSQTETVLLHQDLHGDNVLASQRGWLAIDPKPLLGEKAFGLSPVIRSFEFGESRQDLVYRIDRLCSDLQLDRERAIGWAFAQSIAWSFDSVFADRHYQTARWLLSAT